MGVACEGVPSSWVPPGCPKANAQTQHCHWGGQRSLAGPPCSAERLFSSKDELCGEFCTSGRGKGSPGGCGSDPKLVVPFVVRRCFLSMKVTPVLPPCQIVDYGEKPLPATLAWLEIVPRAWGMETSLFVISGTPCCCCAEAAPAKPKVLPFLPGGNSCCCCCCGTGWGLWSKTRSG